MTTDQANSQDTPEPIAEQIKPNHDDSQSVSAGAPKTSRGRPRTTSIPKSEYTPELLAKIDEMAYWQAKDTTIAGAVGIEYETFKRDFAARTYKQRMEGRLAILKAQHERAVVDKSDTMLIWTGKQHLEQKDKQEVAHAGDGNLLGVLLALGAGGAAPKQVESREVIDALPEPAPELPLPGQTESQTTQDKP